METRATSTMVLVTAVIFAVAAVLPIAKCDQLPDSIVAFEQKIASQQQQKQDGLSHLHRQQQQQQQLEPKTLSQPDKSPPLNVGASDVGVRPALAPAATGDAGGPGLPTLPAADGHVTPNFWHGFVSSLSVIIVSEIGDKTFFIAAIMSMRHRRVIVFAGTLSALVIMTVLSAFLGSLTQVIPREYTHYLSIVLFLFFGVKMLYEASQMSDDEGQEEFEEVEKTLNQKEMETTADVEGGHALGTQGRLYTVLSRVFWQALTLTFVAEWGDRSQLSTMILAARENVWAVNVGAVLGHAVCTCLAVLAGSAAAKKVSVRTITFIGGVVFLLFAVSAYVIGIDSETDVAV